MTKKVKLKIIFVSAFIAILTLMYNVSHKYFIDNYESIETIHNQKSVKDLIKNLNMQLDFINSSVKTFSKWDSAYSFLQNSNNSFIYENFRDGTKTLNNLSIDFLIYTDLKNNIKHCSCEKNEELNSEFYKKVIRLLSETKEVQSIFKHRQDIVYILKSKVLMTDFKGNEVGYLYAGKFFNKSLFKYINTSFASLELVHKELYEYDDAVSYNSLNNIRYKTIKTNSTIYNYLELRDYNNRYIATIKTTSYRDYVLEGRKTVLLFNIIIAIILLIIFYLAYRYQMILHNYTEKLEYSVAKRTQELERSNKELHELAYKDYLTKIDNRRSFFLKVDKLLKDNIFRKDLVHIVMIDIDNFKQINDKYSHDIGDLVLKEFSKILQNNISHKDLCARLGGEEFVLAFTDISTKEVLFKVEKIREETQRTKIKIAENKDLYFTASFGISDNKKTNNIDKILHKADAFLYEVKKSGKNNIRYRE